MSSVCLMRTPEVAAVCALKSTLWIVLGQKLGQVWAHKSSFWGMKTPEAGAGCALKNKWGGYWGGGAKINMVWAHVSSAWVMRTTEVAAVCVEKHIVGCVDAGN